MFGDKFQDKTTPKKQILVRQAIGATIPDTRITEETNNGQELKLSLKSYLLHDNDTCMNTTSVTQNSQGIQEVRFHDGL
ncbi:hypothetical protein HanPSC8_Chr12g0504931 [Helianthus annuus]|nr:hypothetical protein HanPSC8_Chr12g0504931 [Helianthus annuus]